MRSLIVGSVLGVFLSFVSASPASATTIAIGSVPGNNQWGTIEFSWGGGALNIDMLAFGWTGGPTGVGINDILVVLMEDDNSPFTAFTGTFVQVYDDDLFANGFGDGSISQLDSFLSLGALGAGDYVLFISQCCYPFGGSTNDPSGVAAPFLDFQATFSSDVTVTAINAATNGESIAPVPEPSTVLLMGAGLAAIGAGRYRRRKQ